MNAGNLRVGVFGAGVIGRYLGVCLASAGVDVTLLVRRASDVPAVGLAAFATPGRRLVPRGALAFTIEPEALADVDVCLVTVKCRDTDEASATLARVLPATTTVVALQNGLEASSRLAARLGPARVAIGVVACNVVDEDLVYRRATPGDVFVARLGAPHLRRLERLERAFAGTGQRLCLRDDVARVLAGKLLLNLNNGVCAATGLSIPASVASGEARRLFARCLDEGLEALAATGHRAARVGPLPPRLLARALRLPGPVFGALSRRVARLDAHARSSTLVDLERGKPTEIDELNGAIVALARRTGRDAPANALVVRTVHELERARARGEPLVHPSPGALLARLPQSAPRR